VWHKLAVLLIPVEQQKRESKSLKVSVLSELPNLLSALTSQLFTVLIRGTINQKATKAIK